MAEKNYRQIRLARPGNIRATLGELMRYLGAYRGKLIVVVAAVIVSALTSVVSSYFFKPLINNYIAPFIGMSDVDMSGFASMLLAMGGVYLVGITASFTFRKLMSTISTGVLATLRNSLFDHLQDLPMRFYDSRTHGQIMTYFTSDVDTLRQLIAETFPQVVNTAVMLTGITVMMFVLDWRLTLISLFMLGIVFLVTIYLASHGREYFKHLQKAVSNLNGYVEEIFSGQKVVKVFLHESETKREFGEIIEDLYRSDCKTGAYGNMLMPVNANLSYMTYAIVACVGAVFCIRGTLDLGSLASFLLYARQFAAPIARLSQEFNYVMMALAGAERVFQLIDSPAEPDDGKVVMVNATQAADGSLAECAERTGVWAWKDPKGALTRVCGDVRFGDVRFGYSEEKTVLDGISFYAKPGQKIAFVGSTGAGKTTITNLITRFYDIQRGSITYDGFDVKDIAKDSLRSSIGMVLQDTNLFSGSVLENIRYGRLDATDEECVAAAKLANADSFITRLPQGYDTVLSANGANLSQGQRQLLNIARAAVASPPVLVLDEATSSIDTRTEHLIEAGMDELMKGKTVFIIAHRLSTVKGSNAIMVIEHGHIMERGTHEELLAQKGRYYQLYTGGAELD